MSFVNGNLGNEALPSLSSSRPVPVVPALNIKSITQNRYRIIHISDPHLSKQFYREHIKSFRKLLQQVMQTRFDHMVISGDIVSTAEEDDYYLAREILSKFGLLSGDRLTVVPGNHDIFGGPHRAIDVLSFPQHIRSVDYRRHLELFTDVFAEAFQGAYRLGEHGTFPFIKPAGPFLLIGLNSIPPWSLWDNPLGTNGLLDENQMGSLEDLVGSPLTTSLLPVIVIHHHFNNLANDETIKNSLWRKIESNTMRMKKRRKVLKLFRALNVRYVLHGHIHRNEIYERDGIWLANGAGAVCDDPLRFLKFNTLDFHNGSVELTTGVFPIPFETSKPKVDYPKLKKAVAPPRLTTHPVVL
ncbi:MAG TPA: metallophosphoesterase [Bacteroidota bacterium]|nr:metallophosphoesterase [Bacteroidota bacterium]